MADTKISALPASTTPLTGTEVLPIVQSGATKQVSVANLTASRAVSAASLSTTGDITPSGYIRFNNYVSDVNDFSAYITSGGGTTIASQTALSLRTANVQRAQISSTGDITVNTGNLIQGTAAKGVNFTANTPAAGMTSQLLNWYEEGTWTPTFTNLTVVGTPTYTGKYTRIGRAVYFTLRIQSTTSTTSGAGATYFNQPFPQYSNRSTLTAANGNASVSYGVGLIADDGQCYPPTWSGVADVTVSGFYFV